MHRALNLPGLKAFDDCAAHLLMLMRNTPPLPPPLQGGERGNACFSPPCKGGDRGGSPWMRNPIVKRSKALMIVIVAASCASGLDVQGQDEDKLAQAPVQTDLLRADPFDRITLTDGTV